jgi:hypothetical protein
LCPHGRSCFNRSVCDAIEVFYCSHLQVQSCQLGTLVADLFEPSRFQTLGLPAQLGALRALPRLLGTLSDSQAVGALRALCTLCPYLNGASACEFGAIWAAALLAGLRGMLAVQAQQGAPPLSPAMQQAVQQLLVEAVLPRLPLPSLLPASLAGAAPAVPADAATGQGMAAADGGTEGQACWEEAILCFMAIPANEVCEGWECGAAWSTLWQVASPSLWPWENAVRRP